MSSNPYNVNPFGIAYQSMANIVPLFGHPGGMVVVGENFWTQCPIEIGQLQTAGCKVLAYIDPIDKPDDLTKVTSYSSIYAGCTLWPYPTYGFRVNYASTHMSNVCVGSRWVTSLVYRVTQLMAIVDGVMLDVTGARLWSQLAQWDSWPQAEKDAFTLGCVDLVRRIDEARRKINPRFIIVTNNIWDRQDGSTVGLGGESYIDGVMLEHHPPDPMSATAKYASKQFSNCAQRTVIAVASSTHDALGWAQIPGITHVTDQSTLEYSQVQTPCVPFVKIDNTMVSP